MRCISCWWLLCSWPETTATFYGNTLQFNAKHSQFYRSLIAPYSAGVFRIPSTWWRFTLKLQHSSIRTVDDYIQRMASYACLCVRVCVYVWERKRNVYYIDMSIHRQSFNTDNKKSINWKCVLWQVRSFNWKMSIAHAHTHTHNKQRCALPQNVLNSFYSLLHGNPLRNSQSIVCIECHVLVRIDKDVKYQNTDLILSATDSESTEQWTYTQMENQQTENLISTSFNQCPLLQTMHRKCQFLFN